MKNQNLVKKNLPSGGFLVLFFAVLISVLIWNSGLKKNVLNNSVSELTRNYEKSGEIEKISSKDFFWATTLYSEISEREILARELQKRDILVSQLERLERNISNKFEPQSKTDEIFLEIKEKILLETKKVRDKNRGFSLEDTTFLKKQICNYQLLENYHKDNDYIMSVTSLEVRSSLLIAKMDDGELRPVKVKFPEKFLNQTAEGDTLNRLILSRFPKEWFDFSGELPSPQNVVSLVLLEKQGKRFFIGVKQGNYNLDLIEFYNLTRVLSKNNLISPTPESNSVSFRTREKINLTIVSLILKS